MPMAASTGQIPHIHRTCQQKEISDIAELSLREGQDSIMGDSAYSVPPVSTRKCVAVAGLSPSDPSNELRSPGWGPDSARVGLVPANRAPAATAPRVYDKDAPVFRSTEEPRRRKDTEPRGVYSAVSKKPAFSEKSLKPMLQPETRSISHEQLVAEVKGIYAGLTMVEAKCVEADNKYTRATKEAEPGQPPKLNNEQWQALVALHRTLLYEHHDFLLASQHPSASIALRRLALKYAMPARMWRHGIHSFLELLRHRLPDSLEYMLEFIYLAYSMVTLLYETVSEFEGVWIECLGDIARYRMAIEDDDRTREVWTGIARFWYGMAADKSPTVGRLYHHHAILARPNALQQLYYYARSLSCIQPFLGTRESILMLFDPILRETETVYHHSLPVDTAFIKAHGILFTEVGLEHFNGVVDQFLRLLDNNIGRVTSRWKEEGVYIAVANFASLFGYGSKDNRLRLLYSPQQESSRTVQSDAGPSPNPPSPKEVAAFANAKFLMCATLKLALQRIGDPNVLPHVHVTLVFMNYIMRSEPAMKLLEDGFPWESLESMLNTLVTAYNTFPRIENGRFPEPEIGVGRPLPEDFHIRGLEWASSYFPEGWFENACVDGDERTFELASMAADRKERILWLAFQLAQSCRRNLQYDSVSKAFSATPDVNRNTLRR